MTLQADAIYEGGVLRPLKPLDLPEREVVSLSISTASQNNGHQAEAARQRDVLLAYLAKVESRTDDTPDDGFTNRDHDRLIYGS